MVHACAQRDIACTIAHVDICARFLRVWEASEASRTLVKVAGELLEVCELLELLVVREWMVGLVDGLVYGRLGRHVFGLAGPSFCVCFSVIASHVDWFACTYSMS